MNTEPHSHMSEGVLAGVALGETLTSQQQAHVDRCARCRMEVSELLSVLAIAQETPPTDADLAEPPAHVWSAISAATSDPKVVSLADRSSLGHGGGATRSRWRPPLMLAAAAVVGVLVGAGLVAAADAWRTATTVVAATTLSPVPGGPVGSQTGTAQIEQVRDGEVLTITTADLSAPTGYYEVWLLDPSSGGMIAMGVVPGGTGTASLPVPPGVDLTQYAAVDISDEPMDGDPGHSAVSVLRGQLKV